MCGIAGILRQGGPDPADAGRIQRMTARMIHRGPDDFGHLLLDSRSGRHLLAQTLPQRAAEAADVCLGSRRLAILDLSEHGRMPMADPAEQCFITYNGEIYNYLELRRELQQLGHHFVTETDTEVVLHAYLQWGDQCVCRFNGMWAFALWDQRQRRLFCSRDRFGVKPFYYMLSDEAFIFASEVKAILPALPDRPRPNERVIHQFLVDRLQYHDRETFFDGILRLPPAHNLSLKDGRAQLQRYWDYDTISHHYDLADPAATLRDLLDEATAIRLRSDVPTGLALSGGLDSTSVLSCMKKHRPQQHFHAFSARFTGSRFDESPYTQQAAEHFGVQLHWIDYDADRFVDDLRDVIWHLDFPMLNYQPLAIMQVMRRAKQQVTVMLEGQGSDEILAGYQERYFVPHVLDELGRALRSADVTAARGAWRTCRAIAQRYGRTPFLHGAARLCGPLEKLRLARRLPRCGLARDFIAAHGGPQRRNWPRVTGDRLNDAMRDEHARTYLPWILAQGDAISMAASVESRMPFMDYRLVEFAFRLSSEMKMRNGVTKLLLRQATGERLPPAILARQDKIGFIAPAEQWIAATLDEQIRPLLTSRRFRERGYFDPATVEKLLQPARLGHFYVSDSIFQALNVELWFGRFIDGQDGGG
ncbi:MAG: asparagine synthase (glutamine-hydrolyzing) [Phycisphaeraceae bacterium]|nr:asparagine synthase (glutamine-hydrolyzing) [Phycisphaeraceae bacterium]